MEVSDLVADTNQDANEGLQEEAGCSAEEDAQTVLDECPEQILNHLELHQANGQSFLTDENISISSPLRAVSPTPDLSETESRLNNLVETRNSSVAEGERRNDLPNLIEIESKHLKILSEESQNESLKCDSPRPVASISEGGEDEQGRNSVGSEEQLLILTSPPSPSISSSSSSHLQVVCHHSRVVVGGADISSNEVTHDTFDTVKTEVIGECIDGDVLRHKEMSESRESIPFGSKSLEISNSDASINDPRHVGVVSSPTKLLSPSDSIIHPTRKDDSRDHYSSETVPISGLKKPDETGVCSFPLPEVSGDSDKGKPCDESVAEQCPGSLNSGSDCKRLSMHESHFGTTSDNAGETRKSHGIPSPGPNNALDCNITVAVSSSITSSTSSLPSSSSHLSSYDGSRSSPLHNFCDSYKSQSKSSEIRPLQQSYSYPEDHWTNTATLGGLAQNETIKRKQKSLNDIIIRMLNDSSNKVHRAIVEASCDVRPPPFIESDLSTKKFDTDEIVVDRPVNANIEEDDDEDNDNLEIQIDDDVDVEAADKHDGKPSDESPSDVRRADITNGGTTDFQNREKGENFRQTSNCSLEDFQILSSFVQDSDRRGYQEIPDYQAVKPDEDASRVDILESGYLFPYDSRFYNVHLFEKFLPHTYHGEYKTSSLYHESSHMGGRAICNSGTKDRYSIDFGSDAIDLTKNTRPNATASGNSFPSKVHEAKEDGRRPTTEAPDIEGCEKKPNRDHRYAASEAVSYLDADDVMADSGFISSDVSRGHPGSVALLDAEGHDLDELGRLGNIGRDSCSISKMKEEDRLLKDGVKAYQENTCPPKECESKAFSLPPYRSGTDMDKLSTSHAGPDDYCHTYHYQNSGNKSAKYSLVAEMGNSFYAYYANAHYNGSMGLYGSMGRCLPMSDKMQPSESQESSSLETEVLNLAKQDKVASSYCDGSPLNSGRKGEIDNDTESSCCSPNKPGQTEMAHLFLDPNVNALEITTVEGKARSSKGSLSPKNMENQMIELARSNSSNPSQTNSGGALIDQTTYDSRMPQNLQVSSEHHKEMAKTKSMWRDKYLAEDSGLHFTNFSSISRLEQCVSSIDYDKPLADKKDRLKLSADMEKELRSFRMGLKMLGDSGTKSFDGREDLLSDRNQHEASSGRGSSRKSNQNSLGAGESKRNRRSKSSKVSNCKKSCPSEFPHDFNIVNDYQVNGHLSHVPCLDHSHDRPKPPRSCNPADMHRSLPDVNDLSTPETGKKKRGRKKKEMDSSMQNIENHFKSSESSNFSEFVHGYGMPSNNFSGYPDGFYNSNVNIRQQHQMCVTNKYSRTLPQTEKLSSPSILKVPDSHLSSSIPSAKKKHAGASNCLKPNIKDKNKRSAELLDHIERSMDGGDVNDDESFLCNGASLDVYLNEPKECQKSDSWMEDEKQDEETDGKLPFSFDADQKTFTCHHCSYQVKRKGQLMKHLGGHQIFVCTHCNAKCPDRQKLEEHLLDVHPTRCGRRLCKRCHVLFRLEELEQHEIECNGEKQGWACDLCDKKFRFLSAVKNHVGKWHKNEMSKFDSRCDDSVKKSKLKSSSEMSRSGKGIEYVDESTIMDEIQIVDLPQLETTSVEMNFFAEASSPNRDSSTDACSRRSSTPNREKQSTRSDKNKTSAHSKNEKKVRTFQCEMCPKFYRSMQSLKIHRQKKHSDFDEKRTESEGTVPSAPATREASSSEETCNMDAGAGASEGRHDDLSDESVRRDAEGEIAFAKECSEQSSDKPNRRARDDNAESSIDKTNDDVLDDEASGGMPSSHFPLSDGWFQCTYESCSKRFRKLEQVQKHEERHPIDKIYKCDWPGCRKAYIHYANLYSHRSHHITAKPFICNLCSSAYWQKCSLNSHKARVHGIKNLPGVPGPKADGRRVDGPCLDTCDDDSKTITSNVSVSETGAFPDGEKSDNGTASSLGLMQMNNKEAAREDEGVYDRNRCQNKRDDNNNHIALLKDMGKKRTKSISKEDTKSKLKDELSEMNKSESSPNSSNNEREVCNLHEKSSKAIEMKFPKMEMDKSEVSRASTNDQDVASGKKKRGRKPKNAKPLEEKEAANKEKHELAISSMEKPQNVSEVTSGYKIMESRCVVEELLLSTKVPLNQRDPEEMTPLEVALADLGAREIESCDDASFGTEKTKTKRKIRTSLNYRKKSKLAKKFNQEASGRSEMSAQPSATSSTVSVCTDKIVAQKEQPILEHCKDESKAEANVDKSVREEVRSMDGNLKQITETMHNRINKIPEVPKLNLVVESQNTETMMSLMTGEKSVIGNVYEFCESEGEECIGSNKSAEKKSVKKNLLTKKSEIKDSGLQNERRRAEDSDDDASLDFKLSRSKPLKTYLDRPKKKIPSSSYSVDSSSSASLTGEESPQCSKSKQKRKLKSKSPDINQPLNKKLKGDLPTSQNGFSFDVDDRERCSVNDQQVQASKEVPEEKMIGKGTTLPHPTPAKKASKRRKNEVEVLLEDTLSRPATADKKSISGRVSKRSELFNFERSISSKLEIRNSPETKNADIKTSGQKKSPKDRDGASASESAEKNGIRKSEPESSKAVPSPSKESDSGSSEINSEIRSQPIESRLAKKRKAESLVPMFYDDTLQLKGDCTTPKKDLGSEHVVKETVGEIPIENCDSNVCGANEVKDKIDTTHDDVKEVFSSNIQIQEENSLRAELMSVAESPPCSNPNIVLKLRIREVDQTTPACEMVRDNNQVTEQVSNSQDQSRVQSLSDTFNCTDAMVSAQTVGESSKPDDAVKALSRSLTEDNDSQSSLIDSLEYLRIGEVEKLVLLSERSSDMPRLGDEGELALDLHRQSSVASPDAASHLEKQPDNADDYCMEDADDNGGFVKPSEPPSTWRNYDYEDTGYEPQSESRRSKDKVENALRLENGQEEAQIETIKANSSSRENSEPDKLSHFGKANSPEKDGFCNVPSQSADQDSEVTVSKESHVDAESGGFLKSSSIPDPVPLRIGLEEISDKLYRAKNQGFEHPDVAYSVDQFRNGMAESRPISPFNHSKELSHPVSSLHRKDSKLSIDSLAEGQPYSTACSSSYFDYQATAGKKSDPHPLSSLESLATLAPSAGLGGYFDSVVPPEKRLSNDLNKPPRSNNFHPEIPPPPPPHTPFPANPYRNFSGYEADLALLGANRHKGYRYNERPFDPSLSMPYGYDRPDLHHPSYHVGTNFTPPDGRFFSQFLQSTDAMDQRYYGGQQSGFSDFHKAAASGIAGDPKNKFASTSFTSLLSGSPYSGLSDSYLSSLTPNISNAPSLTANQLGNYSRGEGWNGERPWTAVPPSTNDPSIQYQQQQSHSSSRKQQQQQHPPNDYDSSKKTPSSSSASVRGSSDTHFYNSYDAASPRLRNLATPGPPSAAPSGHKRLEEAYRQAAAIMSSDYNQHHPHPSLIQPTPNPAADVYGPVDPMMNPAAFPGFNRYYYSAARDAVYRSQQRLAAMHHHQQQQQQPHPHNPSLSPFSNAVNLAGFPSPGYPPDPFAPLPASTAGMPYSSKNQHYPGSRGVHGNGGGSGKHHQNQIPPLASTGAPPPQTSSKNSKSSKAILPPLGLGGMAPSFDHLNSSNFLHQQNPSIPPDPYRQSVIYNMIPKYF